MSYRIVIFCVCPLYCSICPLSPALSSTVKYYRYFPHNSPLDSLVTLYYLPTTLRFIHPSFSAMFPHHSPFYSFTTLSSVFLHSLSYNTRHSNTFHSSLSCIFPQSLYPTFPIALRIIPLSISAFYFSFTHCHIVSITHC